MLPRQTGGGSSAVRSTPPVWWGESWCVSSAMDGKSRRHEILKLAASPVPGRGLAPETVCGLPGIGVYLGLVDVHDIAPLDQRFAIDNHGIYITPTTKIHQSLDRVGIEGGAEVVEVDEQYIGFGARRQAA